MSARKKTTRKKAARKKTTRKKARAVKKIPRPSPPKKADLPAKAARAMGIRQARLRRLRSRNQSPSYTFDQLQSMFWQAFGAGCGLPIETPEVIDEGNSHFQQIVDSHITDGTFNDEMTVKLTMQCATRCGEVATSVATFRGNPAIDKDDFIDAYEFLEDISGGGQGGLC